MIGGKNFGKTKMPIGWIFGTKMKRILGNNNASKHWNNLKNQSEAFWSVALKKFARYKKKKVGIFEGVNILPHLAHRDLNFPELFYWDNRLM